MELVAREYGARDIDITPSMVALNAEMLQLEQRPFERVQSALKAIRLLKAGGGQLVGLIKNSSEEDPAWHADAR